jgi:hypothetical protein
MTIYPAQSGVQCWRFAPVAPREHCRLDRKQQSIQGYARISFVMYHFVLVPECSIKPAAGLAKLEEET